MEVKTIMRRLFFPWRHIYWLWIWSCEVIICLPVII